MQDIQNITRFSFMEQDRPVLAAELTGRGDFPDVKGEVYVYTLPEGIYVQSDIEGLPPSRNHALTVHGGAVCEEIGEVLLVFPDIMSGEDGKASAKIQVDSVNSTQIAGKPAVLHVKGGDEEHIIACGILERIL